jgi:hypothetical protein
MNTETLKKPITIDEAMAIIDSKQSPYVKEWMSVDECRTLSLQGLEFLREILNDYEIAG